MKMEYPPRIFDVDAALHAGKIQRFHMTPNHRSQTVGEHSYGVAMWVHFLYNGDPPALALIVALTHDMAELYTGDMPAQVKWEFPALAKLLEHAEYTAMSRNHLCYSYVSEPQDPRHAPNLRQGLELTYMEAVIHIADKLELLHECLHELRFGNLYHLEIFCKIVDVCYKNSQSQTGSIIQKQGEAISWMLRQI